MFSLKFIDTKCVKVSKYIILICGINMNNSHSYATIDSNSNILSQSEQFKNIFLSNSKLYESQFLNKYERILSAQDQIIFQENYI